MRTLHIGLSEYNGQLVVDNFALQFGVLESSIRRWQGMSHATSNANFPFIFCRGSRPIRENRFVADAKSFHSVYSGSLNLAASNQLNRRRNQSMLFHGVLTPFRVGWA